LLQIKSFNLYNHSLPKFFVIIRLKNCLVVGLLWAVRRGDSSLSKPFGFFEGRRSIDLRLF